MRECIIVNCAECNEQLVITDQKAIENYYKGIEICCKKCLNIGHLRLWLGDENE